MCATQLSRRKAEFRSQHAAELSPVIFQTAQLPVVPDIEQHCLDVPEESKSQRFPMQPACAEFYDAIAIAHDLIFVCNFQGALHALQVISRHCPCGSLV